MINAGTLGISLPMIDIGGNARAIGLPDIGASEHGNVPLGTCGPNIIVCSPGGVGNGTQSVQFPGTVDALGSFVFIDGAGDPLADLRDANPGSWITMGFTPGAELENGRFLLLIELYASGSPLAAVPDGGLPALHINLADVNTFIWLAPVVPFSLPPAGYATSLQYTSAHPLAGLRARVQAAVLSPNTFNGLFALSAAREIAFH